MPPRRADLVEKYPDVVRNRTPDAPAGDDNRTRLEQARGTVAQLKFELAEAISKRDAIQKELAPVPTTLTVDQGRGGRLTPIEERLLELHRNLDGLLLKYTEEHPDVKAARQAIAQLQAEATKPSGGGAGQAGNAANKGQIADGAYDQIKVNLVNAEANVAAVQRRLSEAETQQTKIEQIARSAPEVLAQVQDLDRDYGVLKRNYMELVARRSSTDIANAADTKTERIQFRIVDCNARSVAQPRAPDLGKRVAAFDRCGAAACRAPADRGDRERLGPGCSIWNVALAQRRSPIA